MSDFPIVTPPLIGIAAELLGHPIAVIHLGVKEDLNIVVIMVFQERIEKERAGVIPVIGRHVPNAQPPIGIGVVPVRTDFPAQRNRAALVPLFQFLDDRRQVVIRRVMDRQNEIAVAVRHISTQRDGAAETVNRFRNSPHVLQSVPHVVVTLRVVRIGGDRLHISVNRPVQVARRAQRHAQVVIPVAKFGIEFDSPAAFRNRLGAPSLKTQSLPKIDVRMRGPGRDGDHLAVDLLRLLSPPQMQQTHAQIIQRHQMIGHQRQNLAVRLDGFLQLLVALIRNAQVVRQVERHPSVAKRFFAHFDGLDRPSHRDENAAEIQRRLGKILALRKRPLERADRLIDLPQPGEDRAEVERVIGSRWIDADGPLNQLR